jgi:hypothetical protein
MYPAEALRQGLYTVDDLPDEIVRLGNDPGLYNKLNPPFVVIDSIQYYQNIEGSGAIYLAFDDDSEAIWRGETADIGPCLISGDIEDTFADTYTVTITNDPDVDGTYTVTRRSICVWSEGVENGEPSGLKLRYVELAFDNFYNWEIDFASFGLWFKDGFANTPTGNYQGPEISIATVS